MNVIHLEYTDRFIHFYSFIIIKWLKNIKGNHRLYITEKAFTKFSYRQKKILQILKSTYRGVVGMFILCVLRYSFYCPFKGWCLLGKYRQAFFIFLYLVAHRWACMPVQYNQVAAHGYETAVGDAEVVTSALTRRMREASGTGLLFFHGYERGYWALSFPSIWLDAGDSARLPLAARGVKRMVSFLALGWVAPQC